MLTKEYNVIAKVSSPKIDISTYILDFGCITVEQPLEKQFTLRNLCIDELHWELYEFTYDFKKKCLNEIVDHNVSVYSGVLEKQNDTVEIVYRVNAKVQFVTIVVLLSLIRHNNLLLKKR